MPQLTVYARKTIAALALLAAAVIFLRWLLIPLLPFLIALAFGALTEPLVERLRRTLKAQRSFAAFVVTTALLLVLGGGLTLLILRLFTELMDWSAHLPELMDGFPAVWNGALDRVDNWYSTAPLLIRTTLDSLAQHLAEGAPSLVGSAGERLVGTVSGLAARLPDIGLFIITTILAVYFTSFNYPSILAFLKRQLPPAWQSRCRKLAQCCRSTLLKWLRAEFLLIGVTFLLLLAGFWWMGIDYALLLATAIALVDALPVLGTGIVLLPWAGLSLLMGQAERAIALTMLYAAVLLTHSLLEPRLLAGQAGLPPITALLAMYLGFHFMGVKGMVLLPILLLLTKQLSDAEIIHLWK